MLSIMSYDTEDEAIEIANDTPFGLAGFVQSADLDRARAVANRIRAGRVYLNGALRRSLPFGGQQSGNGREVRRLRIRGISRGEGHTRLPRLGREDTTVIHPRPRGSFGNVGLMAAALCA